MSWPADEHDEVPSGDARRGPLPPDDRIWRHPSELGRFAQGDNPGPTVAGEPPRRSHRPAPPGPRRPSSTLALAFAAGVLVGAGVLVLVTAARDDSPVVVVERVMGTDEVTDPTAAAQEVLHSLVQVQVTTSAGRRAATGVFFRDDGHLLTTAGPLVDATEITVTLGDGRTLPATMVGTDPASDVAVLRVPGAAGRAATLGQAGDLEPGERIIAATAGSGSQAPVVTQGVVRAQGVSLTGVDAPLYGLVATSHPRQDLGTGGVLVDQRGAVVGLATGRSGTPDLAVEEGGVLAVPVELARTVADDLVRSGASDHPWLGLEAVSVRSGAGTWVLPAAARVARSGSAPATSTTSGAEVVAVVSGGPAHQAGLRAGDHIVAVDGTSVGSMGDLALQVRLRSPGSAVQVSYERDGAFVTCSAVLAPWPEGSPGI